MKTKHLLLLLFFACNFLALQAQPPGGPPPEGGKRREQIESMKVAFLTRRLDLTPEEAQKFWPVYNQFSNELQKLRKDHKVARSNGDEEDELNGMSDKDVEKMVDGEILFRQQEMDVMKKYHAQFKQLLPIKKVAILYRSEEDFKRELLEKLRERRENGKGGGGRRGPEE